ncbi:protein-disulfide reductase DsbD domain-containing protein [Devosia sp. Root436]|uniref:protein-disulfide reductase DsbD domain-containing protein n=1 Tax=Devosia sp. Root436 TaxID=1736537 RepID=UPI00138F372E|nr:protein-disulfide reductase DsbD domain-containing protein [Devosia sp. Root436]
MRPIYLALSLALLAGPAQAGETAWQEVAPGVTLRLISSGQIKPDGTTLIGLEIAMPETNKTYWRVPGETGLPTELDFSGSSGVRDHEILWPYPTRHETADYLDYVYFGPTILPVRLNVEPDAPQIELSAVLGVCSDICVPAQARFSLPLDDAAPDKPNGLRIRQALATTPMDWPGDPQPVGNVELWSDAGMLAVELADDDLDPASLIAATDSGEPLFGTPQKSPEPNLVLIPILGKADEMDLENQPVRLTFLTGEGAFEVKRIIKVPATD